MATSGSAVGRLRAGERVIASWCSLASTSVAELMALAGFDAVILDLEHGEFGTAALPDLLRAVTVGGASALVRVRVPAELGPALDAGADGVLAPDVRSAAAAAAIVAACRYAPEGERGAAPMVRDAAYGLRPFAAHRAARAPLVGVQVAGPPGVAAIDEILAVAGVDLVFFGTFDLAQHLGVPGDVAHPRVVAEVRALTARAAGAGVATGVWAPDAATAATWLEAGVTLVSVGSATSLLAGAAAALRGALPA